jgi:hypothetical protein
MVLLVFTMIVMDSEYADMTMFQSIQKEFNCLYHIHPPIKDEDSDFCSRSHNSVLPRCQHDIYKKSLIPRSLRSFCDFNFTITFVSRIKSFTYLVTYLMF